MQFWELIAPDYDDYRDSYINGALIYPFRLPAVRCETCSRAYGDDRILPFQLPEAFRKRKEIRKGWPLPRPDFEQLANQIEQELRASGIESPQLGPRDTFQPGFLDVPSKPRADFLWCCFGGPVVSERVRELLATIGVADVEFWPVKLRKIGSKEAKLRPPIPESGEPEDIINSVPLLKDAAALGPYYKMRVNAKSDYPPGGRPDRVCPVCGFGSAPSLVRMVMLDGMWDGHDIFFLGGTGFLMVTDRVKIRLQSLGVTNVEYRSRSEENVPEISPEAYRQAKALERALTSRGTE